MAGRYLPTELQDNNGDVVYPHTEADVVWMQNGQSAEQVIGEKSTVVISEHELSPEDRKLGEVYFVQDKVGMHLEDVNGNKYYMQPDSLSSMEEVSANTKEGFQVDALVVKELNNNIGYATKVENGKPFWRERGADTWNPFSKELKVVNLGSNNSLGNRTFSAKTIPNYQKLTSDNFFIRVTGVGYTGGGSSKVSSCGLSYNASTGIVTQTAAYESSYVNSSYRYQYFNYTMYCIYVEE